MSDAKLASTHPRKARNTQLVKDPKDPQHPRGLAPPGVAARRSLVRGWFQVPPFQATNPSYRGDPRCQVSDPENWETALTPPKMGTGAREERTGTGSSPSFA